MIKPAYSVSFLLSINILYDKTFFTFKTTLIDVEKSYLPRKKSGQWSTQIYHLLLIWCLSEKVCLFQNHPTVFPWMVMRKRKIFLRKHQGHLLQEIQNSCSSYAKPHKTTQKKLSDLIRDQKLLKNKAEMLPSRPQK